MLKVRNFRQLFSILFSLLLAGFGISLGLQVPQIPSFWVVPSGTEMISQWPSYLATVTVSLAVAGLLVGATIGPRLGDMIVLVGKSLEAMSAKDKIAVALGTALSVVVLAPIYLLLFRLRLALPIQIGFALLVSVTVLYLGIVAALSTKSELVALLSRTGIPSEPEPDSAQAMANCKILDTNVIIDGRIADVCRTGFVEGTIYVPGFVLEELQHIADSGDNLKRARGRRGLDILNSMQKELPLVVRTWDRMLDRSTEHEEVDTRLVKLAKAVDGSIVTNDFNLNKVAALQGVPVLNVNELANALKPVVLPGEIMTVGIVKEGKEANQGVAYLDDGTMIVVEDGRRYIGETLGVTVTSVLQTVAGKMIFARIRTDGDGDSFDYKMPREPRPDSGSNGTQPSSGGSGYPRRGPGKKIR